MIFSSSEEMFEYDGGDVGCTFSMLVGDSSFVGNKVSMAWTRGRVSLSAGFSERDFGGG